VTLKKTSFNGLNCEINNESNFAQACLQGVFKSNFKIPENVHVTSFQSPRAGVTNKRPAKSGFATCVTFKIENN
jgi:hypothetical protein